MTRTTARMSRRVLVSALSLLFGTAAHAGYYPGHLDPGGNGDDIPGFTGDAVFAIDAGCVPGGSFTGWLHTAANTAFSSGACGAASLYSATINLYTVSTDAPNTADVRGRFTLGPPGFYEVLGVYVENGALAGIDTDAMGPALGTCVGDACDWLNQSFWLQFESGQCPSEGGGCTLPGNFIVETEAPAIIGDPADISITDINNYGPFGHVTFGPPCGTDPNGAPIDCVITTTVPEPGTLALILGALGGGWLARRRKRNASA